MTENPQPQQKDLKSPFSPLQSGCAFVMLTNMLIYLGVVAFTFNLLDPSKLDASYLAKRGFTAKPEPEREEDKNFRRMSEQKREEQQKAQKEFIDESRQGLKDTSSAAKLSEVKEPKQATRRPDEPEKPKAALTQSSLRSGGTTIHTAPSRIYSVAIYPQATLRQAYSPYRLETAKLVELERYDLVPVELAPGIDFPTFSMPTPDPAGAYLYNPPNPVPDASRGGLKLSSPALGAQSLYTNAAKKTKEIPSATEKRRNAKDKL